MQPPRFSRLVMVPLAAAALTLAACASPERPPPEEVAVAQSHIDQALSAGVTEHSPDMISSARDKLERARRAAADGDVDRSRRLAQQARLDAELAMARTDQAKAEDSLAALERSLEELRRQVDR
jgi:septal ring factor EnvC (AmiA/AmiB activator)